MTTPALRKRRATSGFMMLEMMVVLILFGAFLVVSSELYVSIFRAQHDYQGHEHQIAHMDNILDFLHRDVWAATAMRATGARLELETSAGQIAWQMSADGVVTRAGPGKQTRDWSPLPQLSFETEGALVTLKAAGANGMATEQLTLVSMPLLTASQSGSGGGR